MSDCITRKIDFENTNKTAFFFTILSLSDWLLAYIRKWFWVILFSLLFINAHSTLLGDDIRILHLTPAANMDRADLWYLPQTSKPGAVLVLCPGVNQCGENLVASPIWQEFAQSNNLGLVGLSFSSPLEHIKDGLGYYYASKGSGDKLLKGIRKIYGRDLPLLLYGFSGGAQFTSRFEEFAPDHVLAWCAYSAEWWDVPRHNQRNPPGLVACGETDAIRYGASLTSKRGQFSSIAIFAQKGSVHKRGQFSSIAIFARRPIKRAVATAGGYVPGRYCGSFAKREDFKELIHKSKWQKERTDPSPLLATNGNGLTRMRVKREPFYL